MGHELLGHRPNCRPDRRVGADATRVRVPMIKTKTSVMPLGPMPAAVANQQSAAAAPFRPRHSDAFTHQPFNGLLGHMDSTLLLQTAESGVAATLISHIRATGMPVTYSGIALLE